MIASLEILWIAITAPLSWMPDYCLNILGVLGGVFLFLFVLNLIYKLAALIG